MLSVFPELLSLWLFAPLVLRLALGAFFVVTGTQHIKQRNVFRVAWPRWSMPFVILGGLIEIAVGILLVVGLYTQVAALVAGIIALKILVFKVIRSRFAPWGPHPAFLYIFILAIALSLLVLGAGALAFDLPL